MGSPSATSTICIRSRLLIVLLLASIWSSGCDSERSSESSDGSDSATGAQDEYVAPTATQVFTNDGPIRFESKGALAKLDMIQVGGNDSVDYIIDSIGTGAACLDFDQDGDPDIYLAQGAASGQLAAAPTDLLLRNDGDSDGDGIPEFSDVTAGSGLGDTEWSFGVAVADIDDDGFPDIHVTNWGPDRMYRNNGDGTFTDVAAEVGLVDEGWGASAVWADPDRDGDLDLYVTRYVEFAHDLYPARGERPLGGGVPCVWRNLEVYCGPRNLQPVPDRYYRNNGDTNGDGLPDFRDATAEAGLTTDEPYFGLAARFFDADGDGDDDLYVANDSVQNSFFVNTGDGTFIEETLVSGLAYDEQGLEQAGMGVAVGDYDGDGLEDLAVSNFSHDHDTLYHNEGANYFSDRSYPAGLGTPSYLYLAWGLEFADFDQDGWVDLFVARGHVYPQVDNVRLGTSFRQRNGLFHNSRSGQLVDVAASAGDGLAILKSSRVPLPFDLDMDGDLDLLVTNLNGEPDLLVNSSPSGNWLQIRLRSAKGNRDGIGAQIRITTASGTQTRSIRRSAAFLGSTLPVAHFGLAQTTTVQRLEVLWPDGHTQELADVAANQRITLER